MRIAATVRIDEEEFERRLRSGSLCQPRGRKQRPEAAKVLVSAIGLRTASRRSYPDPDPSIGGSAKPAMYNPEVLAAK